MRIAVCYVMIIFFAIVNFAKTNTHVYLSDKRNSVIEFKGDTLRIYTLECNNMQSPAAVCIYKPLRCGYGIINSIMPQSSGDLDLNISIDSILTSNDSILLKFDMNQFDECYNMTVTYGFRRIIKFNTDGSTYVKIGRDKNSSFNKINFMIAPCKYTAYLPNGSYGGIGSYKDSILAGYWGKSITVTLDFIDPYYFSRLYIEGDYIKITEDEICWRNIIFKRINTN